MISLVISFAVFTVVMGLGVSSAVAEKWLGQGIICNSYEDTFSMAMESNLASSDMEALKVYMKYISNKKCRVHKNCEKVIYKGRGSKVFFDKLRKEGKGQHLEIAKMIPISGIEFSKDGKLFYVQDDYLVSSRGKCK